MAGHKTLQVMNHITGIFIVFFLLPLLCAQHVSAETLLSLEDAIDIALEQSHSMKTLRLSLIQAEKTRQAARYRFRTNSDMRLFMPSWTESVREVAVPNDLPIYNSLGTMRYQGLLNINQPLPTGGTVTLSSRLYQSKESNFFTETDRTLKRKDFYTSLRINLNHPLFTYNRLKTGLRQAELNYESTSLSNGREKLNLIYQVTDLFFSLYKSTREHEINSETLEQKSESYELASLKYEAGLIPEVEALQMEVDLDEARANLLNSEASMELQKDQFKHFIGLDLNEDVGVKTDIVYEHFDIDLDKAVAKGLANRVEVRENEISLELQKINVMETNARNEISASLNAYYDFTGRSDPSLPYDTGTRDLFDSSWDDLERRPGNRGVTLIFSVPIWDWGVNKAEVASAEANLKSTELRGENQKKAIINDIRDVVRRVQSAESRLDILSKRQDIAQRTYDISVERFNIGDITSQELAINNIRLTSAKIAYLDSYISYKLAVEDLKRKTLWDFENDRTVE